MASIDNEPPIDNKHSQNNKESELNEIANKKGLSEHNKEFIDSKVNERKCDASDDNCTDTNESEKGGVKSMHNPKITPSGKNIVLFPIIWK